MFLCHSRRLVFVHAPKTAGSATVEVLESIAAPGDLSIGDSPRALAMGKPEGALQGLQKHTMFSDLVQRLPPGALDGYQVLMTVRNPWDRMVSFHSWARAQSFNHPQIQLAKQLGFSAFVRHPAIGRAFSACPYRAYACAAAHAGPPPLFLRIECLEADLSALALRLGLALPPPGRINTSERRPDWRSYYTPDDAAHLARICADDIEQFGYRFEE